jgi:hypothetical protein
MATPQATLTRQLLVMPTVAMVGTLTVTSLGTRMLQPTATAKATEVTVVEQ